MCLVATIEVLISRIVGSPLLGTAHTDQIWRGGIEPVTAQSQPVSLMIISCILLVDGSIVRFNWLCHTGGVWTWRDRIAHVAMQY
jgi:hypothetical protein